MKKRIPALLVLFMIVQFAASGPASACNVCHSKNQNMVRMHAALEYKNCFLCHGPTADRSGENQKARRVSDKLCVRCHANERR